MGLIAKEVIQSEKPEKNGTLQLNQIPTIKEKGFFYCFLDCLETNLKIIVNDMN